MPGTTALNELWKSCRNFCDERKSNKQDLSGLSELPDVLPVSSCDDGRLLIEGKASVRCNRFAYRMITPVFTAVNTLQFVTVTSFISES